VGQYCGGVLVFVETAELLVLQSGVLVERQVLNI
jgi:hypothetical protein